MEINANVRRLDHGRDHGRGVSRKRRLSGIEFPPEPPSTYRLIIASGSLKRDQNKDSDLAPQPSAAAPSL